MQNINQRTFDINQEQLVYNALPQNSKLLLSYIGKFSKTIIRDLSKEISELLRDKPQIYKKIFYVFIELAQNVRAYSDWKETDEEGEAVGIGAFLLAETPEDYYLIIGNVVNNKDLKVLLRKCEIINSLDRESLRLFKRQQRNLIPGTNQNAHIGLIMVALTTRKKLNVILKPIDENFSYFILKISIAKQRN